MILLKWQKEIVESEYDIIELQGNKGVGKTTAALKWAEDADIVIVLNKNYKCNKIMYDNLTEKHEINIKKLYVIGNLMQLRGISTPHSKKVKIIVEDYPEINLRKLDETILHEEYKVMFVGCCDKYKENISKHYYVDVMRIIMEGVLAPEVIRNIIEDNGYEALEDLCVPLELN